MVTKILKLIYESGMYSKSYIAGKLNISEAMVETGVDQLLSLGLLREDKAAPTCGEKACSSCPFSSCNHSPVKTYTLTEKALKLVV